MATPRGDSLARQASSEKRSRTCLFRREGAASPEERKQTRACGIHCSFRASRLCSLAWAVLPLSRPSTIELYSRKCLNVFWNHVGTLYHSEFFSKLVSTLWKRTLFDSLARNETPRSVTADILEVVRHCSARACARPHERESLSLSVCLQLFLISVCLLVSDSLPVSACLPACPTVCRKAMPTCFAFGKRGGVIAKVGEADDALWMAVWDTSAS